MTEKVLNFIDGCFVEDASTFDEINPIDGSRLERAQHVLRAFMGLHEHANNSDHDDVCLCSFNDFPVMNSPDLYAESAFEGNGGHQPVD